MPKEIEVKSVLNKTKKRDPWFLDDYTFNPYQSCSFNCLYCYIRGSKYGENLASSLSVKINAIELLDRQLYNRAKKNQYGIIVLSSVTDPYISIEKKYELTRQALSVILQHRFPVHIITKSNLIERDFDLLQEISTKAILPNDLKQLNTGTIISFSFSTLRDEVANIFEPGAPPPSSRLISLKSSLKNGFLTGVNLMPLLPFISDTTEELHHAYSTFKECGIDFLFPSTISLFGSEKHHSKTLILRAIQKNYPELLPRYQRYFTHQNELPAYYRNAFRYKMNELLTQYDINNSIEKAAIIKHSNKK